MSPRLNTINVSTFPQLRKEQTSKQINEKSKKRRTASGGYSGEKPPQIHAELASSCKKMSKAPRSTQPVRQFNYLPLFSRAAKSTTRTTVSAPTQGRQNHSSSSSSRTILRTNWQCSAATTSHGLSLLLAESNPATVYSLCL